MKEILEQVRVELNEMLKKYDSPSETKNFLKQFSLFKQILQPSDERVQKVGFIKALRAEIDELEQSPADQHQERLLEILATLEHIQFNNESSNLKSIADMLVSKEMSTLTARGFGNQEFIENMLPTIPFKAAYYTRPTNQKHMDDTIIDIHQKLSSLLSPAVQKDYQSQIDQGIGLDSFKLMIDTLQPTISKDTAYSDLLRNGSINGTNIGTSVRLTLSKKDNEKTEIELIDDLIDLNFEKNPAQKILAQQVKLQGLTAFCMEEIKSIFCYKNIDQLIPSKTLKTFNLTTHPDKTEIDITLDYKTFRSDKDVDFDDDPKEYKLNSSQANIEKVSMQQTKGENLTEIPTIMRCEAKIVLDTSQLPVTNRDLTFDEIQKNLQLIELKINAYSQQLTLKNTGNRPQDHKHINQRFTK